MTEHVEVSRSSQPPDAGTEPVATRATAGDARLGTWAAAPTVVGLAVGYGAELEYRFELAAISMYWLVVLIAGAALTIEFRRASRVREVIP